MTCLDVRDRLTEHSLGLLTAPDAKEIDRHLEWCAGCRKESAELQDGAATMAFAVPVAEPPGSLEERIVHRLSTAAGSVRQPSRRGIKLLAVAALAAAMVAVGAVGWAVTERGHVQTLKQRVSQSDAQLHRFEQVVHSFKGRGKTTFQANLAPVPGGSGGGVAVIFSAPRVSDLIFVTATLPAEANGPYSVQLVYHDHASPLGQLQRTNEGGWVLFLYRDDNLSQVVTVTVLDSQGSTVLTGTVHPFTD